MTPISSLLDELYRNDKSATSLEKTAEARLSESLREDNQVEDNPYAEMSTADLAKLALELEQSEKTASEAEAAVEQPAVLEKVAADALGGQVMAHAMVHEFSLIKQAMAQGLCRVCKQAPMDIEGSSICSACTAAE